MYVLPIVLLIVVALIAMAWAPVFALIVAVPLFLAFLLYVATRPRADEKAETSPADGSPRSGEGGISGGIWGERRP
jgi:hypothetical protein